MRLNDLLADFQRKYPVWGQLLLRLSVTSGNTAAAWSWTFRPDGQPVLQLGAACSEEVIRPALWSFVLGQPCAAWPAGATPAVFHLAGSMAEQAISGLVPGLSAADFGIQLAVPGSNWRDYYRLLRRKTLSPAQLDHIRQQLFEQRKAWWLPADALTLALRQKAQQKIIQEWIASWPAPNAIRLPGHHSDLTTKRRALRSGNVLSLHSHLQQYIHQHSERRPFPSLSRPSLRYGKFPSLRRKRQARLLVLLDSSASISEVQLALFWQSLHLLWLDGHEIHWASCDDAVRETGQYLGYTPALIKGGGGTAFAPGIEYANQLSGPNLVLYFTDGAGPPPDRPGRHPLLWVLNHDQAMPSLPGEQISTNFEQYVTA